MKKGGIIALLCLTASFVGFVVGMLVGRNANKEPVRIEIPTGTIPVYSQADPVQTDTTTMERININTASAKILDTLPGIGSVLAQRIVEYRQANGPFKQTSELSMVNGIGPERLLSLLDYITVED